MSDNTNSHGGGAHEASGVSLDEEQMAANKVLEDQTRARQEQKRQE